MRIAILSSRFPFPLERGDKLRIYHQMRLLAEEHELYLYCTCDAVPSEVQMEELKKFCKRVEYFHVDTPTYILNVIKQFRNKLPFQCCGLYDHTFHDHIKAQVIKHRIDLVYCQLIRMAPYASGLKCPVAFDFMDALGVGMQRRAKISPYLLRSIYQLEAKRVKAYEAQLLNEFDSFTVISEEDRSQISTNDPYKINVVPNGVDTEYFTARGRMPKYDVCFIGNLGYLPNITAATRLVNEIAPAYFKKYKKELSILISGARPSYKVINLQSDHVRVISWREDIRNSYEEGKVLCAPIVNGTGQQNKILEAMAMGIPCVTTSKVNKAIDAANGMEILMADSIEDTITALHLLLSDEEIYSQISSNARKFVMNNYSWRHSIEKLNSIFAATVKQSL
jgi:polysaccharide biosynthesis protein PslH